MKLSEAIRLGAMRGPKMNGMFFGDHEELWPWAQCAFPCPGCTQINSARFLIAHLNNSEIWRGHDWTRERIAAWVATIEPEEEASMEPARVEEPCHECTGLPTH